MTMNQRLWTRRDILQNGVALGAAGVASFYAPAAIGQAWANVFENQTVSTATVFDGSKWNRTLIKNCRIRNVSGNGLTLRNVDTFQVENCIFENIGENAIHMSVTGSGTRNVTLIGNTIQSCGKNGITGGQRSDQKLDQKNYRVLNNRIEHVGLVPESKPGLLHGIYVQAQDFLIEGNTVLDAVDGNGISVRSSGVVRGNTVDGAAKSGISYYADHMRGPSDLLLIEQNVVRNVGRDSGRCGIDLLEIPNRRYAVRKFTIRNNQIEPGPDSTCDVKVNADYESRRYSVLIG